MALGVLANPGISSGVLTGDVLDKLKKNDEEAIIKPYDKKLKTNAAQQKDLAEIQTKISNVKSALSDLSDSGSFSKREVSQTGDKDVAKLSVTSGVALGSMSIDVKKLAQRDVYQSAGIKDSHEAILSGTKMPKGDATITLSLGDESWEIKMDETTTYKDFVDKVISTTDGKIQAKILNTGEPGSPYRMSLSSKDSGTDNTLGFFAGRKTTNAKGDVVYEKSQGGEALLNQLGWGVDPNTINHSDGFKATGSVAGSNPRVLETKDPNGRLQDTTKFSSASGKDFAFTLVGGDDNYTITVKNNESLGDIIKDINTNTKGAFEASIDNATGVLKIEAKDSGQFRIIDGAPKMVVDPDDKSGKTMMEVPGVYEINGESTNFLSQLGITLDKDSSLTTYGIKNQDLHMSTASNAVFSYDGVEMTRQSNTVTDLGVGMTLSLEKKGKVDFSITQNAGDVAKSMEDFVSAYNDLIVNVNAATDYNNETGTQGTLQGVSEVSSLESKLSKILFGTTKTVDGTEINDDGEEVKTKVVLSLSSFGVDLNENGTLKFDQGKFEDELNKNMKGAEDFFAGFTSWSNVTLESDPSKMPQDINGKPSALYSKDDLVIKRGDFKLTYGSNTIDLFQDKDGKNFTLTGSTPQERIANLVKHINSFNIEGLNAKMVKVNYQGKPTYLLKLEGTGGDDLTLSGKDDLLRAFGLSAQTVVSNEEDQTGVFAKLKTELSDLTKKDGAITSYSDYLTTQSKDLTKEKKADQESLDEKYDTMTTRWNAYEQILSKLKMQQNAIVGAINAANNQGD